MRTRHLVLSIEALQVGMVLRSRPYASAWSSCYKNSLSCRC